MKTITRKIDLYNFEELKGKAKERAADYLGEMFQDFGFLQDTLMEVLKYELRTLGFEYSDLGVFYSLSYRQGDGLMFEGTVTCPKGIQYTIKKQGHYCHERSTSIEGLDSGLEDIDADDFEENVYIPLCKKVRDLGYKEIEYKQSDEYLQEICEANDYTFTIDGVMDNE